MLAAVGRCNYKTCLQRQIVEDYNLGHALTSIRKQQKVCDIVYKYSHMCNVHVVSDIRNDCVVDCT